MSTKFTIEVKRIVAVDSASFAYVEAPVDDSLLLLATGNYGKTSLINAIRFFFLPELSLKNCASTFAFKNGKTKPDPEHYDKDEVADYYFPSNSSCLILEVEHQFIGGGSRRHCQLITLGNGYKLNRFFIPCPYEDIEDLFWDKSVGITGVKPQVSTDRNLHKTLKEIHKGTVLIRQSDELQKALYSVDILNPDLCMFAIYPLNEIKASTVNSLRALIKLLFNKDSESLKVMTSTSIDIQDSSSGALEVDIQDLIEQQKQLKKEKEEILKLKESELAFIELKQNFVLQRAQQEHEQSYAKLICEIKNAQITRTSKHNYFVENIKPVKGKFDSLESNKDVLEQEQKLKVAERAKIEKELKQRQDSIEKCKKIALPYRRQSTTEVIESLNAHLSEKKEDLGLQTNENKRKIRISELPSLIESAKLNISKVKSRIENYELSLKHQLSAHSIKVFEAVNSKLIKANPQRRLNQDELTRLELFTGLFNVNGSKLEFFDETFNITTELQEVSLQDQLIEAESEHLDLVNELTKLNSVDNAPVLLGANEISKIEKDIAKTSTDIKEIKLYDYYLQRESELLNELQTVDSQLTKLEKDIEKNTVEYDKAVLAYTQIQAKLKLAMERANEVEQLFLNTIDIHLERHPRISAIVEKSYSLMDEFDQDVLPSKESLNELDKKLEASKAARNELIFQLKEFLLSGMLEDESNLLGNNATQKAITDTFENLASKFETIDQSQQQLEKDTEIHNSYVRNRLERLNKTKTQIEKTIEKINKELEFVAVNDITGIKLSVAINGAFDDLVNSWREFDDLNSEATLPETWYQRLKVFLNSDAVNPLDGKLRMENLITRASYLTKKGDEPWDSKGQSTSSQMLINMHFSEIFVKRLCDDTTQVNFPMMMDEVGTISVEQFPPLISALKKQGHSFIGATTHGKDGKLIKAFTNYLVMDSMSTAKPYDNKRAKVCYYPKPEYLKSKASQAELEI